MPIPRRKCRAKAIGRIAHWIARAANLVGVLEIEGEEKHLREFRGGLLFIDLREPFRLPLDAGLSQLRISYNGKKVFEIRWHSTGTFNSFFPLREKKLCLCRVQLLDVKIMPHSTSPAPFKEEKSSRRRPQTKISCFDVHGIHIREKSPQTYSRVSIG